MTERTARVDTDEEGVARLRPNSFGRLSLGYRDHDPSGRERDGEDLP